MTARKRKSGRRTNGGVSLKLRRDGSAGGKEEEEVGSSEAPVPTITTSPASLRQPFPLPVTPNSSLLDLTVTYDYRASVVGEGPEITTEELSSMFTFQIPTQLSVAPPFLRKAGLEPQNQDSPTVHPPLLPLWGDLGCSPQLPARKRPRTSHPSPLHTTSTPQQNRFQHLDRLAQQLHQCLSEPQEGRHPEDHTTLTSPHHHTDYTTLTFPHHHTDHTTLTSPHHHTDHTTLTSPHHHTDHTTLTSPHLRTEQTTLTSPHQHTDQQPHDTIEEDDNMFWSQAADVVASSCWEPAPSPEHPSTPSPEHPSTPLPDHPSAPSPDPFGESDADAFIDQLLSGAICLTTPAKQTTSEQQRSSEGSANSLVSVVQVSANPVKESRAGTGLAADGGSVVLEAAHGTNVNVTCSGSKDGKGGVGRGAVDGSREQLAQNVAVKCSLREIERKRELARQRLYQRQRWKPAPANTD